MPIRRLTVKNIQAHAVSLSSTAVLLLGLTGAGAAHAGGNVCGSPFVPTPVLHPILPSPNFPQSDGAVNCFMWQTFVYLTWPALAGQAGQPDPNASYGSNNPTVWETFRPHNTVFLPHGAKPAPWGNAKAQLALFSARGLKKPLPNVRVLNSTSKKFRAFNSGEAANLTETQQAGGGVLVDQNGQTVYYEMLMNQTEFNYIVNNTLYEANAQNAFAKSTGIELPTNAVEVKPAWKVLSAAELAAKPVRFHTAQALLPGQSTPVTVGLVGLHVLVMPDNSTFEQGFWATFQQVDNAPLQGSTPTGTYSFYNVNCPQCPVNTQGQGNTPTQVVQVFGTTSAAQAVNQAMQQAIVSQNPQSPWQFYQLINVQWPTSGQPINKAGMTVPLPNGSPNTNTLMNPVLETYLQVPNMSCLGCHTNASAAGGGAFGSSYSFLLGHAKTASAGALKAKPR
ncbi:MAG TPA: hypothetical protein VGE55_11235 [Limnobacter sp.]|uniref:hypothetical protein n=1 Tax=Limnobacter sp. TaxID=2003368 RepID=UPI002ED77D77